MDYRTFEQRLLETIFTTDVPITPASVAFLYKISTSDASSLLQKAAIAGVVNMDSDDEGNVLYSYPNRVRLSAHPGVAAHSAYMRGPAVLQPGYTSAPGSAFVQNPAASMFPRQDVSLDGGTNKGNGFAQNPFVQSQQSTTQCLFCRQMILVGSKQCPHCHEYLDFKLREQTRAAQAQSPGVPVYPIYYQQAAPPARTTGGTEAALLSFFLPGLGQICNGRVGSGVLWMVSTFLAYFAFIIPGLILHVLCIVNAAKQPQTRRDA